MVNDPIGDMLIQIQNAVRAGKQTVELPLSKAKKAVADILVAENYLRKVEVVGEGVKAMLRLALAYDGSSSVLSGVSRKSKPGMRLYVGKLEIPTVMGGMGISILSTPQGVMTGKEAKKRGIGGELLCEVW